MSSSYSNKFTFAALPRTERGKPLVLGADPKGKTFLYTNGNSVIIRDLANPEVADVYTQHSCAVTVAKYSPSGFYISSADRSGKIRIWDTVNKEHILKNEYQPISGPIYDLAWSNDNQRIVCVGEGREKFGHVFLADTGTSNGDITGQSRPVNTCDFKPSRPFRIVTGSEDNTCAVYEGPPFKFKCTKTHHSRYVQCVRYSPDGSFWISAGFDGKIFLYDGKDSEMVAEFTNGHNGGVYGIAWSGDGKKVLSASGDKTCKIWDVERREAVVTLNMGSTINDQQLGCLWSGEYLLSVSLSGYINYLDPNNPDRPSRIIKGHNKPITTMSVKDNNIITASSDGRVIEWDSGTGESRSVEGEGHGTQVNGVEGVCQQMATVGIDDTLRFFSKGQYTQGLSVKLNSQPKGIANADGMIAVATLKSLVFVAGDVVLFEEEVGYEPTCIAMTEDKKVVAVGDSTNQLIHVYEIQDKGLVDKTTIKLTGSPTDLTFSKNQEYLVSSDANRKVTLLSTNTYERVNTKEWGFHTAKVNCVSFSPDSLYVASGGLDCSVIVWSVKTEKHLILASAHVQSQITGVKWLDNQTIVSCGQDGNVKVWNLDWKN